MPVVKIVNMSGKEVGDITLSDKLFGADVNGAVLHAAVRAYLMNQRQGTQSTLTRTEVSGGGKKPWRQKGTGRARQGSTRSPQWTHGGVALGPKPRDYSYTLNKKVKRLAIKSALSDKAANGNLIVVDSLTMDEYKTKTVVGLLNAVGAQGKSLVATAALEEKLVKSAANISGVKTSMAANVNTYDVLNADKLVVDLEGAKKLEEVFA